jgi:CRISPR-associated protein Csx17
MSVIHLAGCRLEPLGSYLKGLSVLRLVSEQEDQAARGWWEQGCFHLETKLDEDGLVTFFLERYAPTPILSPWNRCSGFYPNDRKVGIEAIAGSTSERFAVYRQAIERARTIPGVGDEKSEDEDERRRRIQLECRNRLPDGSVEWLDAAVGISAEDKRTFAPILGTGGNEGHLDYTNNLMEYLSKLLIALDGKIPVKALLRNALFGTATGGLEPSAVGQYDPGRAGGANQGEGVKAEKIPSNPWNFVLTLEGAVAWAAGLHRRQGVAFRSFLCSPFTVRCTPVGYGSAAAKDKEEAEIWAPIWDRRATYAELKTLLREGRASVDGKPAQNGLEFAEAACMLGVDRGIDRFMRYNLLERRGKGYYIALPVGKFDVRDRSESDLVRELDGILDAADWQMRPAPAGFDNLRRQVDGAMYNVLLRGGDDALEELAASLGRLHRHILLTGKEIRLPANLSRSWVSKLAGSAEARIAAALAGTWDQNAPRMVEHLKAANGDGQFSWQGTNLAERMARTLERRSRLVEQNGLERNPLGSAYRAGVGDAIVFLEGSVDDERIEDLMFAFTLVNWRKAGSGEPKGREDVDVWPVFALLKHLFTAEQVETGEGKQYLKADMGVLAALIAGDVGQAVRAGVRRLQNAGIARAEMLEPAGFDGMRLAAALLIPVPFGTALQRFFRANEERRDD